MAPARPKWLIYIHFYYYYRLNRPRLYIGIDITFTVPTLLINAYNIKKNSIKLQLYTYIHIKTNGVYSTILMFMNNRFVQTIGAVYVYI